MKNLQQGWEIRSLRVGSGPQRDFVWPATGPSVLPGPGSVQPVACSAAPGCAVGLGRLRGSTPFLGSQGGSSSFCSSTPHPLWTHPGWSGPALDQPGPVLIAPNPACPVPAPGCLPLLLPLLSVSRQSGAGMGWARVGAVSIGPSWSSPAGASPEWVLARLGQGCTLICCWALVAVAGRSRRA